MQAQVTHGNRCHDWFASAPGQQGSGLKLWSASFTSEMCVPMRSFLFAQSEEAHSTHHPAASAFSSIIPRRPCFHIPPTLTLWFLRDSQSHITQLQHLSFNYWLLMGIYNSSKPLLIQIITLWGTFIRIFVHTRGFISRINFLKWNWKGKECMHFYFTYCPQRGCNNINFY